MVIIQVGYQSYNTNIFMIKKQKKRGKKKEIILMFWKTL
jgi:hypothetical protein